MVPIPAQRSAPWWEQVAAFVAAFFAFFAIGIVVRMAEGLIRVGLMPVPIATIIACLVTIRVRSLWPAGALAALGIGFYAYAVALNMRSDTFAAGIAIHLGLASAISLTGQLAVGALAGWLWYRRESRFARPAATA